MSDEHTHPVRTTSEDPRLSRTTIERARARLPYGVHVMQHRRLSLVVLQIQSSGKSSTVTLTPGQAAELAAELVDCAISICPDIDPEALKEG